MPPRAKLTAFSLRLHLFADRTRGLLHRLRDHFDTPPPTPLRREILLSLTTFQTGILDVATFMAFRLFVANMTGNVVILGAAIAHFYMNDIAPNCVALGMFILGGIITGIIERITNQCEKGHTRLFFAALSLFHCILYFVAAALVFTNVTPVSSTSRLSLITFALLALGQGSQIVLTKRAGLAEFTTAVITSTIGDISSDPKLFHFWGKGVRGLDRRVASVMSLLVGAIAGGEIYKFQGYGVSLFVGGGISFLIMIGWSL